MLPLCPGRNLPAYQCGDFVMALTVLPPGSTARVIVEELKRSGALIIEDVLPQDRLQSLVSELRPFIDRTPAGHDDFLGRMTKRTGALVARSPQCRDLILHDTLLGAAREFLSPYTQKIILHLTQTIEIGPGGPAQPIHRDRYAWGTYLPTSIEPQFNTIWALTDFTKENGATQIVPGSHKWDKDRVPSEDEIAYAEMTAGSVLLYTGTVLHGGGENITSSEARTGVFLHYALNWLRQEENQYLSCPPEIAKDLSPEIRSLIGYSKGGYVLGFYSDPNDKSAVYESVSPENMFKTEIDDDFSLLPNPEELVSKSNK